MTVYPNAIDGDAELIRVDDAITEIGAEAINQLREAVFAIEQELGIKPAGTVGSLADFLDVSFNDNGTIKTSAFASVGLVTLPITNNQVGTNAGIEEYKLDLDHSTSDLYNLAISNQSLITSVVSFSNTIASNLTTHIAGGSLTADGDPARHVASHIDLNAVPSDSRDLAFSWTGLLDKDGVARTATTVAAALLQINDDLVAHQNAIENAHPGTAISLDVDNFTELPQTVDTVQKLAQHVNDFEVLTVGEHRAVQHANGIPLIARSDACSTADGYSQNVVPPTSVRTYLVTSPNIAPVDDLSTGDDIISFVPDNSSFLFDGQFSQVRIGDIITVNYGSGFEASFLVESVRYVPGSRWVVRINGTNLVDNSTDGYALARIDRPAFDRNTAGILAVASANATPVGSFNNQISSVIVGHPKGAVALGNGFDAGQLNATHYNLYLTLYPTGNPSDRVISLPAIDVTGNAGATPGYYTLESVVQATNNSLRKIGYNYRMIAFAYEGNFGIMMADAINCASFSITSGSLVAGSLAVGSFTNNVVGDAVGDGWDALGFGSSHADLASPAYSTTTTFPDSTAAQSPTKIFVPFKRRNYVVDGRNRDSFAATWNATEDSNGDYYWDGYIAARNPIGTFTVETTYTVNLDLKAAGLRPGKTIVVQPTIDFSNVSYFDVDYGRFIIKSVTFPPECPGDTAQTSITVINGLHANGSGFGFSSSPELPVRIYFTEDTVSFNDEQVISTIPTALNYHRLHEIYIDNKQTTFSHERARLPVQNETGALLATTNWHVRDVSPKLRGYADATLDQDHYVRLFILSYDTTTGEYDGYIGKRSGTGILSVGPVTTGVKNVPVRFYDETNVDYIDLVYVETGDTAAGATTILSDGVAGGGGTPRYVDIELFPTLQTHDQLLLLATCEVNWEPSLGQAIVERVVDRREFGSVDEEDFTQSAMEFISAGDRALHENGVVRGLEFDYVNASNNAELFFKGGVAFVNGNVLLLNNASVTIPQITENPTTTDTLDWAICVNDKGYFESVLLTPTKQQFFARDLVAPNNTYYVPSYTFQELVDNRKDLTPIYIANVTIASVTLNSTSDVRRFISDGKGRDLVFSPADFAGTFHTVGALKNWVNNYATNSALKVKVRGTFEVSSSLDFTGFNYPVVLEGDGAVFNVTANQGLLLGSNVSIKNIYFTYNPSSPPVYVANDRINSGNGCLYSSSGVDLSKVKIEDCVFNSSVTTQRPPFVCFNVTGGDTIDELFVLNNRFNDANSSPADRQTAIAIYNENDLPAAAPALVSNSKIEGNICNNFQGIYLLSETNASSTIVDPGVSVVNSFISKNDCGIIGFLTSGEKSDDTRAIRVDRGYGLTISDNTCLIIGTVVNLPTGASNLGTQLVSDNISDITISTSTGPVSVVRNSVSWIAVLAGNDSAADEYNQTQIIGNRLSAYDNTFLDDWSPVAAYTPEKAAIYFGQANNSQPDGIISQNIITQGYVDSTEYFYNHGIMIDASCSITDNIIKGLIVTSGRGIYAGPSLTGNSLVSITGNKIYRESRTITRYIELSTAIGAGTVMYNVLDDYTLDGASDTDTITLSSSRSDAWCVSYNKNHQETMDLVDVGRLTRGNGLAIHSALITQESWVQASSSYVDILDTTSPSTAAVTLNFDLTDSSSVANWMTLLSATLPLGVRVIDAEVTIAQSVASGSTEAAYIRLSQNTTALAQGFVATIPVSPSTSTIRLTDDVTFTTPPANNASNRLRLEVEVNATGTSDTTVRISAITVTFRW